MRGPSVALAEAALSRFRFLGGRVWVGERTRCGGQRILVGWGFGTVTGRGRNRDDERPVRL
eukprot:COSAG02_NODE_842_length_16609_cov_117.586675_12_plen_61_part_00